MKLLYFSPSECWPPSTGARLRNYHLAHQLASRCEVTYFGLRHPTDPSSVDPPADTGYRNIIVTKDQSYSAGKVLRGIIGPTPVTVLNCFAARIAAKLEELLQKE